MRLLYSQVHFSLAIPGADVNADADANHGVNVPKQPARLLTFATRVAH